MDERTGRYAQNLSKMIQMETISSFEKHDPEKFRRFQGLLRELFPHIFGVAEYEDFDGSFVLRWKGKSPEKQPVIFMNHHDVVEATGNWEHEPFSGDITDDKVWGRGTLDTKGGLWGMLQAADELAEAGFVPECDIYFESSCTEETTGDGCRSVADAFEKRGIRFSMSLDEGGMMMYDPIGGARGTYAMVGMGEKGCADLRFVAKSNGGHASTPGKNTPLVRLGKFMADCEKSKIFKAELSPVVAEMFRRLSKTMSGALKVILGHPQLFKGIILKVVPSVSQTAAAFLKTTLAFTMAKGSGGTNVLPETAWVIGNMRFSHHQGQQGSFEAVKKLAEKYELEMVVEDPGMDTKISDYDSRAFRLVEDAVNTVFPGVITAPYIMTGCSDSRFIEKVCDNCIRFTPFKIDDAQLASIHGLNENVNTECLAPAVDFYKYLMENV